MIKVKKAKNKTKCKICGNVYLTSAIKAHYEHKHGITKGLTQEKNSNSPKLKSTISRKTRGYRKKPKADAKVHRREPENGPIKPGKLGRKKPKKITLISIRGKKVEGNHECDRCGKVVHNPHRYAESSIGPVTLCASCKIPLLRNAKAKVNSKIKTDALDHAKTGGRFEGNRSKH